MKSTYNWWKKRVFAIHIHVIVGNSCCKSFFFEFLAKISIYNAKNPWKMYKRTPFLREPYILAILYWRQWKDELNPKIFLKMQTHRNHQIPKIQINNSGTRQNSVVKSKNFFSLKSTYNWWKKRVFAIHIHVIVGNSCCKSFFFEFLAKISIYNAKNPWKMYKRTPFLREPYILAILYWRQWKDELNPKIFLKMQTHRNHQIPNHDPPCQQN